MMLARFYSKAGMRWSKGRGFDWPVPADRHHHFERPPRRSHEATRLTARAPQRASRAAKTRQRNDGTLGIGTSPELKRSERDGALFSRVQAANLDRKTAPGGANLDQTRKDIVCGRPVNPKVLNIAPDPLVPRTVGEDSVSREAASYAALARSSVSKPRNGT
jgi:hypothetical protein